MSHRFAAPTCIAMLGSLASAQSLVPAGNLETAESGRPIVMLVPDDPAVQRAVTALRDRFEQLHGAEIIACEPAPGTTLAGKTLLVYATPEHPWLRAHARELPFTYDQDAVAIEGRRFTGAHLRVIAAVRNPDDRDQKAVLYTAAHGEDLIGINSVFHGPTEWVVADGNTTLAAGAFLGARLTVEQQRADLDELVAKIKAVHPAAVSSLPPELEQAIAAVRARIDAPLDRATFAQRLAGVLVALHDGHSALALPASGQTLALPLLWLQEGLIVREDAGGLRTGDRVLAIAGRDVTAIEQLLAGIVPAENSYWLREQATRLLCDPGILRQLGLADAAPVAVRIERDGSEQLVQVPAAGPAPPRREPRPAFARFTIDQEHGLGVFTLDACRDDQTYQQVLREFFVAVHEHGLRRIAVDLRANSGGNSRVVDRFLGYLAVDAYDGFSSDVRWSAEALAQRQQSGPERFEPARANRRENRRVDEPPPFDGELFVLTTPATFSSATDFATIVHDNHLGRIVGEPGGGAPSSYGDILYFVLPQSCCSYTLSFKRWVRPDPQQDPAPALLPDVAVPRTRQSIKAGSDQVLEWLRAQR